MDQFQAQPHWEVSDNVTGEFDTSTKMRNLAWSPDGLALVATAGWQLVKVWPAAPWTKKSR